MDTFKKTVVALALLAALGCKKSEAERFGYKGSDLDEQTNMTYLSISPTVTNWVPERVLAVCEKYEFTPDELGVLAAAGVLMPGANYPSFPEGYAQTTKEPWFSLWTKPTKAFGFDGVSGILAHWNEDSGVWETSESYFSSYWKSKDEALTALAGLEAQLAKDHKVKKFHKFPDCWIAEYVRLSVVGVVGQKADGTWSCMLDIRDKNNSGCGAWEPLAEQQTRLNQYVYTKEMRAWRAAMREAWTKNSALVATRAAERALAGFTNALETSSIEPGRKCRILSGDLPPLAEGDSAEALAAAMWTNHVGLIRKNLGVSFAVEPVKEAFESGDVYWRAAAKDDLYETVFEVMVPASTNTSPHGVWRIVYADAAQP